MTNFGELKTKLLTKLTESYTSNNKGEIKDLVNKLKSNKSLSEMYVFYENIENLNTVDHRIIYKLSIVAV